MNVLCTTIPRQFFAICVYIFHKTEVLTVILRCLTGLTYDWFKSYDTKHEYFHFFFLWFYTKTEVCILLQLLLVLGYNSWLESLFFFIFSDIYLIITFLVKSLSFLLPFLFFLEMTFANELYTKSPNSIILSQSTNQSTP